ncbi:MAG: hypothetical protein K8S54_06310 [Spirochaetia bacterium]|nr:hypothetical protein [Spirochaetia bacterium]
MKYKMVVMVALALVALCSGFAAPSSTMWDDYAKLRLVCFWKVVPTEKDAMAPWFPPMNRMETPYVKQMLMGQADISASFFVNVTPTNRLMANSLLEGAPDDTALVTTRMELRDQGKAMGDNHSVRRNTSGQNFIWTNSNTPSQPRKYLSYSCGVYQVPVPAQPALNPGESPRVPPIN